MPGFACAFLLVKAQHDHARFDALNDFHIRVALQPGHILNWDRVDEIDIAGKQSCQSGCRVLDWHQFGAGQVVFCLVPPAVRRAPEQCAGPALAR